MSLWYPVWVGGGLINVYLKVRSVRIGWEVGMPRKYRKGIDMIYLLAAIGLSPGGRNTVHIYTQIIHRTIQNKQYIEVLSYVVLVIVVEFSR